MKTIIRFFNDEEGATAIEYGLIVMLISIVILGTLQTVGTNLNKTFTTIATALK